ncbi:hypothetical protein PSTT_12790 [Puccinia striiformis]|uniref:Uncharacterized protein n=1 Tax=Puccinia striiformis TaxID=27350 RepID=A0A2S4UUJ3_9BASI|nr:hypothetical protein PSTT_12790 [Puccinia striiformis]
MSKIPAMRPDPPCDSRPSWPINGKALATAKGRLSIRCVAMMAEIWSAAWTDLLVGSPAKRPRLTHSTPTRLQADGSGRSLPRFSRLGCIAVKITQRPRDATQPAVRRASDWPIDGKVEEPLKAA